MVATVTQGVWGEPLVEETRTTLNGQITLDCIHTGGWAWVTATGQVQYQTPMTPQVWLRSTAKPFQALPMVQAFHQVGRGAQLTDAMVAVACASHVGTPAHQQTVSELLALVGLTEEALHCGNHPPIDKPTRRRFQAQRMQARDEGQSPENYPALGHNCSGNHAGQLVASVLNDWPIETYTEASHPVQQAFIQQVVAGLALPNVPAMALDGCGIPTIALSLVHLAQLYAQLVVSSGEPKQVVAAIAAYPEMFGGLGRVDSAIVEATEGTVIAKVGADGVIAAANTQTGEGVALKIAHGGETPRNRGMVAVLKYLGWLTERHCQHPVLAALLDPQRRNGHGEVIGSVGFVGQLP